MSSIASGVLCALLLPLALVAQQTNVMTPVPCAFSINGTGWVDAANTVVRSSSETAPPPAGSVLGYHHNAQAKAPIQLRMDGPPGAPIALIYSPYPQVPPIAYGTAGQVEVSFVALQILLNGLDLSQWQNWGAVTGPNGAWSFLLPAGLPDGVPLSHLQGAVFDSAYPAGFRLTASQTIQVRNDLPTLMKNVVDSVLQTQDNPVYLQGLLTPTFRHGGEDQSNMLSDPETAHGSLALVGIGPNSPGSPALPVGAPTPGQSAIFHGEFVEIDPEISCGVPGGAHGSRSRSYSFVALEQGGVWKLDGDQHPAYVEVDLCYLRTGANSFETYLCIGVEEEWGRYGGVSFATISGPQLQNVSGGQSQGTAFGTQNLNFGWSGGYGESSWDLTVELGQNGSRQPWVEGGVNPVDQYTITLGWNNPGIPPSVIAISLRSAVDPVATPSLVAAACPTVASAPALTGGGLSTATVDFNLAPGTLPFLHQGQFDFEVSEPFLGIYEDLEEILPSAFLSSPAVSVCAPFLMPTVNPTSGLTNPVTIEATLADIFGARYISTTNFAP